MKWTDNQSPESLPGTKSHAGPTGRIPGSWPANFPEKNLKFGKLTLFRLSL